MDTVYAVTAKDHNNELMVRVFSTIEKAVAFMEQLREFAWKDIEFHSCPIDINC